MKTKYKSGLPKTSGWQRQYEFDCLLSDLDVSSLKFLKFKYNKDIRDFGNSKDLNEEEEQKKYKEMLQRKHMIDEELEQRDIYGIKNPKGYMSSDEYFDSQTGFVINENGQIAYSISFNEEETGYIYSDFGGSSYEDIPYQEEDDEDGIHIVPIRTNTKVIGYSIVGDDRKLEDIYRDWDYYDEKKRDNR